MSTLSEDRRRAIEQSGWGQEFRLVQPHNLAFWVYCLLVVAGAVVVSGQLSIAAAAYSGALISGIIAFGLLAVAYLWFIHYEDRYTSIPPKLAAAGFVWGGVAAIGAFALLGNDAVMSLYAKTFGASFAFDWGAALTAPIDEELAKGAGIVLLVTLAPQLIRSPFDGLILGAISVFGSVVPVMVAGGIITVFVWVYRNTVPIEREWMRELMAPEVELGVVTPAELDALAGSRSTLRRYVRSQPSRRMAEHVLEAETDLAQRLARDGGADTAAVRRARAAVARARSG